MDDADRAQMVEEAERERAVPEQFREQLGPTLEITGAGTASAGLPG